MKPVVFIFLTLASLSATHQESAEESETITLNLSKDFLQTFYKEFSKTQSSDESSVTAVVNDYADRVLEHLGNFSIKYGIDPIHLGGFNTTILIAEIIVDNGTLNGISTASRNGDVVLSYSSSSKIVDLTIPLAFTSLEFIYDYNMTLLQLKPRGELHGKIEDFTITLELSFDFLTYNASVKQILVNNSGKIGVSITGIDVVDVVVDILSELVTTVLHPFIIGVIEGLVKTAANYVVNIINTAIGQTFTPPVTSAPEIPTSSLPPSNETFLFL